MSLSDKNERRRRLRERFRVQGRSKATSENTKGAEAAHEGLEDKEEAKGPKAWLTTITYEPRNFIMAMLTEMMSEEDNLDMSATILDEPIELVNGNFPPGYYTIYCTFLNGPSGDKPFEDTNNGGSGIPFGEDKPLVLFQLKNHKDQIVDSLTLPVDPIFNPMNRARVPGLNQFDGTDCSKANSIMRQQERAFAFAMSSWLDPVKNEKFFNLLYGVIVGNAWPMMTQIFDEKHGIGEMSGFDEESDAPEASVTPKQTPKPHPAAGLAPEAVAKIQDAYDVLADAFVNEEISGGIHALRLSIVHGVKEKIGDAKQNVLIKTLGVGFAALKDFLDELERLEFRTLYNSKASDHRLLDEDPAVYQAIDCLVDALMDKEQRPSFGDTTAMGRISYEIASRVNESLQGNKARVMEVLDVNARGMGWLFAVRYSDTPQFPEANAELS